MFLTYLSKDGWIDTVVETERLRVIVKNVLEAMIHLNILHKDLLSQYRKAIVNCSSDDHYLTRYSR